MKSVLTLLIGLFLGLFNLSAQEQEHEEQKDFISRPCYFTYPEGENGLKRYFAAFFSTPKYQKGKLAEGKIVVSFIVNKKGIAENPRIIHSTNPKLDNIVIESINKMTKWIPDFNCKNKELLVIIPFYFGQIGQRNDDVETVIQDGIYLSKSIKINTYYR